MANKDFGEMTIPKLKGELTCRNARLNGRKTDLVERYDNMSHIETSTVSVFLNKGPLHYIENNIPPDQLQVSYCCLKYTTAGECPSSFIIQD